jgi:hypothetical protein
MTTRTAVLTGPALRPADDDRQQARRRFGAIVSALTALAPLRAPEPPDDALARTRRINRIRRLLGKLPVGGKSRQHTRPPR